jgi:pimeloyl-ACP methyl ester carboxylesterase
MEIMRQAPHRVSGLALLDTRATADTPEETQRRRELMRLAQTARGFQPVTRRMLPLLVHASRLNDEGLVGIVRDMAARTGIPAFVHQQHAIIARPDGRDDIMRVDVPSLVLCGRQDAITSLGNHEEMANLIPAAELVVIENCGHLSTLEQPDEVSRAMRRWLGRISNDVKPDDASRT